ncbi:hypothetical protein PCAR4_140071 [Paraburkholderia caribensis]|nr:hypothetical protein PCAR4_140071 [Paraburkholderia caribensis]
MCTFSKSFGDMRPKCSKDLEADVNGELRPRSDRRWAWDTRSGGFDWMDWHGPFEIEAAVEASAWERDIEVRGSR